jgi:hypothetical protein
LEVSQVHAVALAGGGLLVEPLPVAGAFASDMDSDFDVYTMDADGSDIAQVTNARVDVGLPH